MANWIHMAPRPLCLAAKIQNGKLFSTWSDGGQQFEAWFKLA